MLLPLLIFCSMQFGKYQSHIDRLTDEKTLPILVQERKDQINSIKAHWREKLPSMPSYLNQTQFQSVFSKGILIPAEQGCGGAYFLYNETGKPLYVIKPIDEDLFCLNNRKQYASPFFNHLFRVRSEIPLYRTAQAEALAFAVAEILGFETLTPKTEMMILSHEAFNQDHEKLCSVQEYLEEIIDLQELAESFVENQKEDHQILQLIDRESFENLYLLIWLLYDNDAHAGNLYAKQDEGGTFHLIKIDNSLTFPEKNKNYLNDLFFLPHAKSLPSEKLCSIVKELPLEKIAEKIRLFELDGALDAFFQRVAVLQKLFSRTNLSFREIDIRFHSIHREGSR